MTQLSSTHAIAVAVLFYLFKSHVSCQITHISFQTHQHETKLQLYISVWKIDI